MENEDKHPDFVELTRGRHPFGADINKGIWAYKEVSEPGQITKRRPAILLHSNPLKEGSEATPWVDIVEPDQGYAIFNGDNRNSSVPPLDARGNSLLNRLTPLYFDPALRRFAPPILLFTQRNVNGNRKGFREFSGYGIPSRFMLLAQREKDSERYFTNLVVELALFSLAAENEVFDWDWIDCRRNGSLCAEEVLKFAPSAWRLWVREGTTALEKCRRRVASQHIVRIEEQLAYSETDRQLIQGVISYFGRKPHAFEGLASLVAACVIGPDCKRGWITKRSGDGGVDFVCRLDLGSDFSRTPLVVLGQAKCESIRSAVSGKDLARIVARLHRGWLGVFVTTGVYSLSSQRELHEDNYPVILINGKRMARELRNLLNIEDISLTDLLNRESFWYGKNLQPLNPERILEDGFFVSDLEPGKEWNLNEKE